MASQLPLATQLALDQTASDARRAVQYATVASRRAQEQTAARTGRAAAARDRAIAAATRASRLMVRRYITPPRAS